MQRGLACVVAFAGGCGRVAFDARNDAIVDGVASDGAAFVPGLIHRWRFDETAGTQAADELGTAPATLAGGAAWGAGRCDGSLVLDGSTAYAGASLALGTGALSITAWIYPRTDGANGHMMVISEETNGGVTLFSCERNTAAANGQMICADSLSTAPYAESLSIVVLGTWTHFAMTRTSGGLFTIYLDGAADGLVNQAGGPPQAGGASVFIGSRDPVNDRFDGLLDDVRIYDRELTANEVLALFGEGC